MKPINFKESNTVIGDIPSRITSTGIGNTESLICLQATDEQIKAFNKTGKLWVTFHRQKYQRLHPFDINVSKPRIEAFDWKKINY